MPLLQALWALLAVGGAPVAWSAEDGTPAEDPAALLRRLESALATRNYQGVFVHVQGGQTETLRIVHRVTGGQVSERLASLDGSGREFIRSGNEIHYYLPDQKLVLVEQSAEGGSLLPDLHGVDATASGRYTLRELERTRASGRLTRVIALEPRDGFRYGYRLWIDDHSALPVKSQLLTQTGQVVAQLSFTELTLPRTINDDQLATALDTSGYRWSRYQPAQTLVAANEQVGHWRADQLPPGFRMTAHSTQKMPGESQPVAHLVFSDGVARVSAFVEPGDAAGELAEANGRGSLTITSESQVGSSSTYSTVVRGTRITVIGEVPPDTVRAIAQSLRPEGTATDALAGSRTLRPRAAATNRPATASTPPR